jgi:FixJ family two-component response regulator
MATMQPKRTPQDSVVLVVDDDESVRGALDGLFRSVGIAAKVFGSASELLEAGIPDAPCCLVLDVRLPAMNGLDLHAHLLSMTRHAPVIFITGHGDIPMSVRAMKSGAVDFLAKPVREQDLLDAVQLALERDRVRRGEAAKRGQLEAMYKTLTVREREVMGHVTAGLMNKQIAGIMGLSEITVKVHRGSVMRKTNSRSLAELVKKAEMLFGAGAASPDEVSAHKDGFASDTPTAHRRAQFSSAA